MKITMPSNSAAILVRPRTVVMPDSNHRNGSKALSGGGSFHSFIVLALCGASMFLLVVSACLISVLVLVGKNLSTTAVLSSSNNITAAENTFAPNRCDKPIQSSIKKSTKTSAEDDKTTMLLQTIPKNIVSKVLDQLHFRLPAEIRPTLYELLLHPDLQAKQFSGNVSIHVKLTKPMQFIAVHANKLNVTSTVLEQDGGDGLMRNISVANAFSVPKFEYWVTEVAGGPLDIGEYVLRLQFNGSLVDNIVGLYGSTYYDPIKNESRFVWGGRTNLYFLSLIFIINC